MKRSLSRAALGAVVAAGIVAPSAQGALVVNSGVHGVRLQMTQTKVRAILGPPAATRTESHPIVGRVGVYVYRGLVIRYFGGRVGDIITTRTTERTKRGVGVGSTEAQVRAGVGGITCETVGTKRLCQTGALLPGAHVTTFDIRAAKVWRIRIGMVVD